MKQTTRTKMEPPAVNPVTEEYATLSINGSEIRLPIVTGTEGERAIDISNLRKQTKLITLDPGLVNTGACKSSITFIDSGAQAPQSDSRGI